MKFIKVKAILFKMSVITRHLRIPFVCDPPLYHHKVIHQSVKKIKQTYNMKIKKSMEGVGAITHERHVSHVSQIFKSLNF